MTNARNADAGDLIVIRGHRLGESSRIGEILEVVGTGEHERYRVHWDDDRETIFTPGSDAVIQHTHHREEEPVLVHEP
jgi:hypothetical protein